MKIFGAQFLMVMLFGVQSLNVNGGHKVLAALTSFALGIMGFWLTATISELGVESVGSAQWWLYILAGPCAIVTAITVHPWLANLIDRRTNEKKGGRR